MWSWHRRGARSHPCFRTECLFPQRGEPFPCKGHRRQKKTGGWTLASVGWNRYNIERKTEVRLRRGKGRPDHAGESTTISIHAVGGGGGGGGSAIAMEELANLGTHTFVRVGTCGGIRLDVRSGDVVVATGAVRMEGTSREYAPHRVPRCP